MGLFKYKKLPFFLFPQNLIFSQEGAFRKKFLLLNPVQNDDFLLKKSIKFPEKTL